MSLDARLEACFATLRDPSPRRLGAALERAALTVDLLERHLAEPGLYPYGRKLLFKSDEVEVLVMNWLDGVECAPHDHGRSYGWVQVVSGSAHHRLFTLDRHDVPVEFMTTIERAGRRFFAARAFIHSMKAEPGERLVTVHAYAPPITEMKVYDLSRCAACIVSDDCGAWWPREQRQVLAEMKLGGSSLTASSR